MKYPDSVGLGGISQSIVSLRRYDHMWTCAKKKTGNKIQKQTQTKRRTQQLVEWAAPSPNGHNSVSSPEQGVNKASYARLLGSLGESVCAFIALRIRKLPGSDPVSWPHFKNRRDELIVFGERIQ